MIKCDKCGAHNQFDGASFCKECGSPLHADFDRTDHSEHQDAVEFRNESPPGVDRPAGSSDDDTIDEVLRLIQDDSEPAEPVVDAPDSGAGQLQIEDPADYLVSRQMGDSGSSDSRDTPEPEAERQDVDKSVVSDSDRQKLLRSLEEHLAPEDAAANEIKSKPATEYGQDGPVKSPPAGPGEVPETARAILRNKNVLVLPKSARIEAGQQIDVAGRSYQVQTTGRDYKTWYLAGAFLVLLLVAAFARGFRSSDSGNPVLFGVVRDAVTDEILAGIDFSVPQARVNGSSDENGIFAIDDLEAGVYQVRIHAPGYSPAFYPVTLETGESKLLCATLVPLPFLDDSLGESESESDPDSPLPQQPRYGKLIIKTNLEDVEVVVNNKVIGVGNKSFSRMKPGNHILKLRREGFLDYVEDITIKRGKTTEIAAVLARRQEESPPELTAEEYIDQAEKLLEQKKYIEAIGYFTLAIAKDKRLARAYRRRAEANILLGQKLNAQADLLAAANLYARSGRFADAIDCYDRIIAFVPTSATVYQRRGWARIYSGDYDGGLEDLEHGHSLDEDNYLARFQYGKALYQTGNYKPAEKQLKKIRKYAEDLPEIMGYLALTYLGRGDDSDARKYYEKFTELASQAQIEGMETESSWQQLTALAAADN